MNTPMNGYGTINNPFYIPQYPNPTMPQMTYPASNFRSVIAGRGVDSEKDINPVEVPNDRSLGVFPKNDGTAIYVKFLNDRGVIETKTYIPAPEDFQEIEDVPPQISLVDIANQLNDIQNVVNSIQTKQSSYRKPNSHHNKNNQNNKREGDEVNA